MHTSVLHEHTATDLCYNLYPIQNATDIETFRYWRNLNRITIDDNNNSNNHNKSNNSLQHYNFAPFSHRSTQSKKLFEIDSNVVFTE